MKLDLSSKQLFIFLIHYYTGLSFFYLVSTNYVVDLPLGDVLLDILAYTVLHPLLHYFLCLDLDLDHYFYIGFSKKLWVNIRWPSIEHVTTHRADFYLVAYLCFFDFYRVFSLCLSLLFWSFRLMIIYNNYYSRHLNYSLASIIYHY